MIETVSDLCEYGHMKSVATISKSPKTADGYAGRTLASDVKERLRLDIVGGLFAPGEKLRFEKIREIYHSSFTTLREALSYLVQEGLVVVEGQRGYKVAPLSKRHLDDLTDTRVLVELELLKASMQAGGNDWETRVLSAFHKLGRIESAPDLVPYGAAWSEAHKGFHGALLSAADRPILQRYRMQLFEQASRYHRLLVAPSTVIANKAAEHRAIMELVLRRDTAAAIALSERHIRETSARIFNALRD